MNETSRVCYLTSTIHFIILLEDAFQLSTREFLKNSLYKFEESNGIGWTWTLVK